MTRVKLSRTTSDFLYRETRYLRVRSAVAADKFIAKIERAKVQLSSFPETGQAAPQLPHRDARTSVLGDYLLDYVYDGEVVQIVNARHGQMRPQTPAIDLDDDEDEDFEEEPSSFNL